MISELVIDVQPKTISIAVLEDKNLVEFHKESCGVSFSVGNIYVGKVKKLMPGLNAAFIDIGGNKEGFLHYRDLGSNISSFQETLKTISEKKKVLPTSKFPCLPDIAKEDVITNVLEQGESVLVQIAKEPISTKGPRLTSELSFAGRYLVIIPFGDKVNISSKIQSNEERVRLKQLIDSIRPKNFNVIIRTSAEGKRVADLDKELKVLVRRWNNALKLIKSKSPTLVHEETGRIVALLRDNFNSSFEHIYINDEYTYNEVYDYLNLIDPSKTNIVTFYKDKLPIFDSFAITKQIKLRFGKTVPLKSGAYLIIEQTEAMHVIDVNSGKRLGSTNQENMVVNVNMEAAEEIARQLRLRDMGGIIVIDFIDMHESVNRQKVYDSMCKFMVSDKAKHNVLPISKVGLMEITRQRIRPNLNLATTEACPVCFGKGSVKSSIFFTDTLEENIKTIVKKLNIKKIDLYVHPYIAAFINQGFFSLKIKWKFKYSTGLGVIPDQSLGILEYRFFDKDKNELNMRDGNLSS